MRLKMFFPPSTIKKFHVEIVFVAWLRDLSWEVKIVCLFLQENSFRKFLILLLFICMFFIANIVCICYYFRWLSWPFLRARASQWYTAPFLVFFFLRGVGPRCVGLARKILAHCNTGSYVFSFFFIFIFILFPALSHMYVILIPPAPSLRFGSRLNIDQNWNLFYHYLFAIYFH